MVLVTRLGRLARSVLPIDSIRNRARAAAQESLLNRALDLLSRDPWSALDAGSDIPRRLIEGWGNASWSTDDEYLIATIDELGRTLGPVLECGSGLSTIVVGIVARQMGREVWTLEHDAHWGGKVGSALARRNLDCVHLCVSPLRDYGDFSWYDPPLRDMPRNFGLVVCDGPPGHGHGGRSGFLPVMRDRLAPHCAILLDDTIRENERAIAHGWSSELGAPAEFRGKRKSFAAIRIGQAFRTGSVADNSVVTLGLSAPGAADDEVATTATIRSTVSMRDQAFDQWSLLVSSTAGSEPAERWTQQAQADTRIHCFPRRSPLGRAEIHNGLARKSRSPYFKWLRPGECLDDGILAVCVAALEADGDAVLAWPAAIGNENASFAAAETGIALMSSDPVQRFAGLLSTVRSAEPLYGVIRTSALRKTALLRDTRAGELVLLAELALLGKFVVVRPHDSRRPAGGGHSAVDDPRPGVGRDDAKPVTGNNAMPFLMRAVWRSKLGPGAKLACLRLLSAHAARVRQWVARNGGK